MAYRLCHDDPDWPAGLDRTLSTHTGLDEAIDALHAAVADNTRRLDAAGDGGAALALAVVDPAGATVMCVWAGPGGNTRYRFPDPHKPQPGGFQPG